MPTRSRLLRGDWAWEIICGWGGEKRKRADETSRRCWLMRLRRWWQLSIWMAGWSRPVTLLSKTVFLQASGNGSDISESDRKSALQEFLQGRGDQPAEYKLAGESGPDHQKPFLVEVWVKGNAWRARKATQKRSGTESGAQHIGETGSGPGSNKGRGEI